MKRDYVCRLRLLIDNLHPSIRESRFLFLMAKFLFNLPNELFTFREDYKNGLIKDLSKFYCEDSKHKIKRTSEDTDINSFCLRIIEDYVENIKPNSVLDVGCGTGFLLGNIDNILNNCKLIGIDFSLPLITKNLSKNNFKFIEGDINYSLKQFKTNSIDFVICAHLLEHLDNPKELIIELRRITRLKLILICPLEKPFLFGLNYHVHFFENAEKFLEFVRSDYRSSNIYDSFERLGDCMYIESLTEN